MALSKDQIDEMLARRKAGETRKVLADAFDVSEATVKYHEDKVAKSASDPEAPSDADLGIGEEDEVETVDHLAAMFNDPRFAKHLDALVAARVAQMGVVPAVSSTQSEDFKAFTASLAHLIEVNAMQQPGYVKPVPAEEVDRRAAGYVEMKALLKDYEAKGDAPLYLLGDFFFECTNALSFEAGQQIRTYLPPAEHFIPKNEPAEKVYAAMIQWIGGKTPDIGDLVEAAERDSRIPLVTGALNPLRAKGLVEAVDAPVKPMVRNRVLGTIAPERHGAVSMNQPTGPTFVGADAVAV